jgi:hypothetical protein
MQRANDMFTFSRMRNTKLYFSLNFGGISWVGTKVYLATVLMAAQKLKLYDENVIRRVVVFCFSCPFI